MKTGLIDTGGGFRGIYGSGIMDYFMDKGITFDYTIGVSAGSANIASYLAGQRGRNIPFYIDYGHRKDYVSFRNLITKHVYLDLDYVYRDLSNTGCENPLDYDSLMANPSEYYLVATNGNTGERTYFDRSDFKRDDYSPLIASCTLPLACKPCYIDGVPYYDGGLSDPIPVQKAFDDGCDKVVVILTRPQEFRRESDSDKRFIPLLRRESPACADRLAQRHKLYNYSMDLVEKLAENGKALILAPDNIYGMSTIRRTDEAMEALYQKGYEDAKKVEEFLKEPIKVNPEQENNFAEAEA